MYQPFRFVSVTLASLALLLGACGGNNTTCSGRCNDAQASCRQRCTDDACRTQCDVDLNHCTGTCTSTPADGG
jgi:hypothetical protein